MAHPTTVHPGLIKLASLLDYDATLDTNESSKSAGSNSMGEDASTRANGLSTITHDHTTQTMTKAPLTATRTAIMVKGQSGALLQRCAQRSTGTLTSRGTSRQSYGGITVSSLLGEAGLGSIRQRRPEPNAASEPSLHSSSSSDSGQAVQVASALLAVPAFYLH